MGVLSGQTALVTGGGRGIGKAIALAFAAEGATVAVASRTLPELEQVAAACGPGGLALPLDVTDPSACRDVVNRCESELGRLDILVNNAGIASSHKFMDIEPEIWDRTLAVDLGGPFHLTRAALPGMLGRGSGTVIAIASMLAKVGRPYTAHYAAAKHGLLGMMRSLAAEYVRKRAHVQLRLPRLRRHADDRADDRQDHGPDRPVARRRDQPPVHAPGPAGERRGGGGRLRVAGLASGPGHQRPGDQRRRRRGAILTTEQRWKHFRYAEENAVATVTFDRPERLNALTFEVYADIRDLCAELKERPDQARVLVIRGEGKGFCSGGDVEAIIGRLLEMDTRGVYDFARMTGACVRNLREMPQPVIAAVNGIAAGAGAVLAAACDLRVLAQSASFQFLFTRVGISGGDMGVCWLLPRLVGAGRAAELLLLGERIDAGQCLAWGLANRVVPDAELDAAVADQAGRLLELAPWGLAMTKEMLNRAASMDYSSAVEMEAWTQTLLMTAADFREFHAGFTGKRKPKFTGR